MEAKFHLDYVDQAELDKMIKTNPELMVLNHLWEISVGVDADIEKDSFDAHNELGDLKNYPTGPSAENVKVTWAMDSKELNHALTEVMDLSKEVARLLNDKLVKEKSWDSINESTIMMKLNDNEKELVKNLHKVYHSKNPYDITSILNETAMTKISNEFLDENSD